MKYIRTEYGEIFELKTTSTSLFVIRDKTQKGEKCYVSYRWGDWRKFFLTTEQNCALFSYDAARNFISDAMLKDLNYNNLVIELYPGFKEYKQADTIEELCDEFVVIYNNNKKFKKPFTSIHDNLGDLLKEHKISECKVYGAIWTDKGLTYVAKMNDKRELELL